MGPETFVALGMPRSIESVVAIWSVTKAGAAFVPVDPAYPRERVEYMLADCRASLGLTVQTSRTHLPDVVPWLELDDPHFARRVAALSPEPITDDDRTGELNLDHPAYLIYTSGSTGKPKGVNITHRGLASFTAETRERFEVTHDSHVSQLASPSFDASIFELTMAFSASAQVVIVPPAVYGGAELADVFRREQVTHATITPTALAALGDNGFEALRVLDLVGEACPPEVVAQWAPGRRLHNGYGPTETTVQASVSDSMKPGAGVNIGSPAVGFGFLVLDERLQPVPVGVPGELYIIGQVWHVGTIIGRRSRRNDLSRARTDRRGAGCTAPEMSCVGVNRAVTVPKSLGPAMECITHSNTSGAATSRSRSVVFGSNSGKSMQFSHAIRRWTSPRLSATRDRRVKRSWCRTCVRQLLTPPTATRYGRMQPTDFPRTWFRRQWYFSSGFR